MVTVVAHTVAQANDLPGINHLEALSKRKIGLPIVAVFTAPIVRNPIRAVRHSLACNY